MKATPALHAPAAVGEPDRLLELLQARRGALCHEWRLMASWPVADDDLLPLQSRIEDAMVQVDLALERAGSGRYGLCARCAGAIDFQRLLVHPAATLCWPCQQAEEQVAPESPTH
jgi:hypothetical protein